MKNIKSILLIGLLSFSAVMFAQQNYSLDENASSLVIEGTSSVHDWQMKAEKFTGKVAVIKQEGVVAGFENAQFSFRASEIISDNSIMNRKAHDALETKKHPEIVFSLSSINKIEVKGKEFSGTLTGNLSLAGESKKITVPFKGRLAPGENIVVEGSKNLRMSEFGISPPTAMLGALKTGDEVTVKYVFILEAQSDLAGK
jgi:polyisoprenoid-binding protein YceI